MDVDVTKGKNVDGDNSDSNNDKEKSKAAKLYQNTIDQLFTNPNQTEVDELLKDWDDDLHNKDYSDIDINNIIGCQFL